MIAATLRDLPGEIGPEAKKRCARILTELAAAKKVAPEQLAGHRRAILEQVAPEIAEQRLRKELEDAERSAYARRQLTFTRRGDGEYRLSAIMTTEAAATIRAALDPLSAPGMLAPPPDPDAPGGVDTATAGAVGGAVNGTVGGAGVGVDGAVRDGRTPGARRIDALTELCRRALTQGELPDNGGEKPHLVVTLDWEKLRDGVAGGLLDTGDLLTPATVRRLACDALLIPAVLNSHGQPLDLGRARRLIDGPLRRALVLRDRGCAFPSCTRPPAWCDGHHITPWTDGGTTCLANSCLLCGFHHRLLHHTEWTVHIGADGHPWFTPPPHIDPDRRPRRNQAHPRG
jgi:hypothetical protein